GGVAPLARYTGFAGGHAHQLARGLARPGGLRFRRIDIVGSGLSALVAGGQENRGDTDIRSGGSHGRGAFVAARQRACRPGRCLSPVPDSRLRKRRARHAGRALFAGRRPPALGGFQGRALFESCWRAFSYGTSDIPTRTCPSLLWLYPRSVSP